MSLSLPLRSKDICEPCLHFEWVSLHPYRALVHMCLCPSPCYGPLRASCSLFLASAPAQGRAPAWPCDPSSCNWKGCRLPAFFNSCPHGKPTCSIQLEDLCVGSVGLSPREAVRDALFFACFKPTLLFFYSSFELFKQRHCLLGCCLIFKSLCSPRGVSEKLFW